MDLSNPPLKKEPAQRAGSSPGTTLAAATGTQDSYGNPSCQHTSVNEISDALMMHPAYLA
jgi:hypothetical protein